MYVVAVVAGLLVVLIGALPTIIEKLRGAPPAAVAADPDSDHSQQLPAVEDHRDRSPPTDTLRSMILDLQGRLTRSEHREDQLQERLLELTRSLATAQSELSAARTEIEHLRTQVEMLSLRRN